MELIVKKVMVAKKVGKKNPESKYVVRLQIAQMVGPLKVKRSVFSHSDEKLSVGSKITLPGRIMTWRSPEGFDWLIGAE
jgi:hypothetical protein